MPEPYIAPHVGQYAGILIGNFAPYFRFALILGSFGLRFAAFCLGVRLFLSPPIGQAFADDCRKVFISSHGAGISELGAAIVTEVEFGKVTVQMLFSAVLISAVHPALEHAENVFDCVRMDFAANVFLGGMLHGVMPGEFLAHFGI